MFKYSPRRAKKQKGFRAKHAVQICMLLGVVVWLFYQVRGTNRKGVVIVEESNSEKVQEWDNVLKLGRKDIPEKEKVREREGERKHEDLVDHVGNSVEMVETVAMREKEGGWSMRNPDGEAGVKENERSGGKDEVKEEKEKVEEVKGEEVEDVKGEKEKAEKVKGEKDSDGVEGKEERETENGDGEGLKDPGVEKKVERESESAKGREGSEEREISEMDEKTGDGGEREKGANYEREDGHGGASEEEGKGNVSRGSADVGGERMSYNGSREEGHERARRGNDEGETEKDESSTQKAEEKETEADEREIERDFTITPVMVSADEAEKERIKQVGDNADFEDKSGNDEAVVSNENSRMDGETKKKTEHLETVSEGAVRSGGSGDDPLMDE